MCLDHTQLGTHLTEILWTSDCPFADAATYKTRNKHKRQKNMPSAGFEPAIAAIVVLQSCALHCATAGIGCAWAIVLQILT